MADPSTYRPRPGEIPTDPGVYRFRDAQGRVIYVGKAKNLRQRLSSYFQDVAGLHPRTQTMVRTGASVEWTVVSTEVEALQLEYSWIKEFDPRFNVKYRDDKSYPYLAVTMGEEFPRAQVMRGAKRPGTRYFGPYAHAWAIRETLDQLLRVFPVRTCSKGVFHRAELSGRPCLLGYIDKCSAPCVGRVDAATHRAIAEDLCDFLGGNTGRFVKRLETQMREAAAELEFETAARLRDDLGALERALERSAVVLADATDADVFGMASDELEVAVQVFHVRGGRVRGQRGWVSERESADDGDLVQQLLMQVYGAESAEGVPREVLVPTLPTDAEAVAALLSEVRGARVAVRVPQRGDKRALAETVTRNAEQALARHKVARAGDLTSRGQALADLQEALGLAEAPLRIECFDVSHVQGTNVVASMVVFEDGLPRKGEYRRFIVRGEPASTTAAGSSPKDDGRPQAARGPAGGVGGAESPGVDDTAAMREVLTRRFRRHVAQQQADAARPAGATHPQVAPDSPAEPPAGSPAGPRAESATEPATEPPDGPVTGPAGGLTGSVAPPRASAEVPAGIDPETGKPRRFAYAPQLVVVDGGLPQVNAAQAALDALGVTDVALVGLAKRLEEVWLPGEEFPVILPRGSEALFLLQRVRDEAHRFAITFHRQRRSKAMTVSALDAVPGLGPARRAALLKRFGSVKALRAASPEELATVPGIGPALAATIAERLAAGAASAVPAVNVTTGEILD